MTGKPGTSKITTGVCYLYSYLIAGGFGVGGNNFGADYRQVHSDVVRSFLGNSYTKCLDILLERGYLERLAVSEHTGEVKEKGAYTPPIYGMTGKSKQFRIPAALLGEDKKYKIIQQRLGKADQNKFAAIENRVTAITETYRLYVREQMKTMVLLDSPESRQAVDSLGLEGRVREPAENFLELFNYSPFNEVPIDLFGHRVHSRVVNLPRLLRPYLRFPDDDSPLVEIDLVNSQPAILASITPALIKRFAPECKAAIPLFKAVQGDENYQRYQQLCFDKTIYETLQKSFNETYGEHLRKPLTRDDAKDVFYAGSFSDYEYLETETLAHLSGELHEVLQFDQDEQAIQKCEERLHGLRCYLIFKKEFPAVHSLFRQLKALDWSAINRGEPHSNNCLLAQRIESNLIYTVLVKSVLEAGISQVVTIHDALLVRRQDEKRARALVEQELRKLNLKLKLKQKS
ncbi:hypothetical protein H8B13_00910 [Hymenobacter sp. BT188]|uniref:hypothetical protein n=1 Tax=Hymenobacter sp. BT188 TaxID=2763504 RepID=UPI001651A6F0|nr:hypothetical protein [Hymenobacter sp. BT188]MBC6605368.1 hypothetical protein [Hymenobacter sp. BT188]